MTKDIAFQVFNLFIFFFFFLFSWEAIADSSGWQPIAAKEGQSLADLAIRSYRPKRRDQ